MYNRRIFRTSIVVALLAGLMAIMGTAHAQTTLGGSVTFRDSAASSDSLVIALTGLTAGATYEGRLYSSSGNISTGALTLIGTSANQTYTHPSGGNLLATYSAFAIADSTGTVLYADSIPAGAFGNIGNLLASSSSSPSGKGLASALKEQAALAVTYGNLADAATTLGSAQTYARNVINILEGSGGSNYHLASGDPGDGRGVLTYANDVIAQANEAKASAADNTTVTANADGVIATANNVIASATKSRDNALSVVNAAALDTTANRSIDNMQVHLNTLVNGRDSDGDGVIEAIASEGGANRAYTAAQDIGLLVLVQGEAPSVGDSILARMPFALLLVGLAAIGVGASLLYRRKASQA